MGALEKIKGILEKGANWTLKTELLGQLNFIRVTYRNSPQVKAEIEAVRKAIKENNNSDFEIHMAGMNIAINDYNTRHLGISKERKKAVVEQAEPLIKEHYEKKFGDENG